MRGALTPPGKRGKLPAVCGDRRAPPPWSLIVPVPLPAPDAHPVFGDAGTGWAVLGALAAVVLLFTLLGLWQPELLARVLLWLPFRLFYRLRVFGRENVPAAVVQRLNAAQRLISQAAGTSRKKKAKRLMRNGIEALKGAAGIAAKAERKGTISSGCAASVAAEFRNAKTAGGGWLRIR